MPIRKRRTRASIHVRLAVGKDQDLIAWWEALPTGTGAEVVKRAIRDYLERENGQDRAATAADVEAAARWVVEQVRTLALTPTSGRGESDGVERLTAEQAAERL